MDCYLCRFCKTIVNIPVDGLCEQSPDGEHDWITGDGIEDHVQMVWDGTDADLTNVAG